MAADAAQERRPMGHSRDEKTKSHDRIVEIAAARIRESGTEAPSVAEIMKAAGLTHGGFYKHFGSRDDLVAEAAERALAEGTQTFQALTTGAPDPLAAFVDHYLSPGHRDEPETGCAVTALGADAPRSTDRTRTAYTGQVRQFVDALATTVEGDDEDARKRAIVSLSSLVGSLFLARAVNDEALSDELLREVASAVKAQSFAT